MYAVIRTGGKQYKVAKGDVLRVEKLAAAAGEAVRFGEVLMLGDGKGATVGAPLVKGASVTATVLEQMRDDKIVVFKKKRRKNYRRKAGHRQPLTVLRVTEITAADAKDAPKARAAKEGGQAKRPAAAETPAAGSAAGEAAAEKAAED